MKEGKPHHLPPHPLSSLAGRDHQGSWTQREGWQDLQQRRSPGGPDNHRHITRFHKSSPLLNLASPPGPPLLYNPKDLPPRRIFQGAEPEQLVWGRGLGAAAEFSVGISIAPARPSQSAHVNLPPLIAS